MMMMAEVGFWAAWGAGAFLLTVSVFGLLAFWRLWRLTTEPASRVLAVAILLGIVAAMANTAYWQVFGQAGLALGVIDLATLRLNGQWLDVLFKGSAGVSVLLHLLAYRDSLPEHERRQWSVLGMAFYPNARHVLARMLNGWRKK